MSNPEVEVWKKAAPGLLEDLGFTTEQIEGAQPVPVPAETVAPEAEVQEAEQVDYDEFDLPEIAPVPQEVFDELGDEPVDDEPPTPSYVAEEVDDDAFDDEGTRQLKAKLRKAEQQLAKERQQRVESNIDRWREKYKKMYVLADVDSIKADSRRSFERAAAVSHNKNYELLRPHIDAFNKAREGLKKQTVDETRQVVADAWGKPHIGPGAPDLQSGERNARIEQSRKNNRSLAQHFKTLLSLEDENRTRSNK